MNYVFQFLRILIFCFLGEVMHAFLPLPIPASIYGLLLLLAALLTGIVKPEQIRQVSTFLIKIFPILFVPAAAGVMDLGEELSLMLLPCLLAVFLVTALVMIVSGKVTDLMIGRSQRHTATGEKTEE